MFAMYWGGIPLLMLICVTMVRVVHVALNVVENLSVCNNVLWMCFAVKWMSVLSECML